MLNQKASKSQLRKITEEKTLTLTDLYRSEASASIVEKVVSSKPFRNSKTIFIYVSTETEVDTCQIIETAFEQGKTVAVPLCTGPGIMKAVEIRSFDDLKPGFYGIMEPVSGTEITKEEIDLAVIPSVTCDQEGNRLGHGMGYYDRFLQGCRAYKMALCFDKILADQVPTDENDVRMDLVITELQEYEIEKGD